MREGITQVQSVGNCRDREPIKRGRPARASSEEDWILSLLPEAGERGASREWLIFTARSTQCGRAVNSLDKRGYVIEHAKFRGEKFVRYILRQEPLKERTISGDWYTEKFGRPRPSSQPQTCDAGPLFSAAVRS